MQRSLSTHLESLHERLDTANIIPNELHQTLVLREELDTCWGVSAVSA